MQIEPIVGTPVRFPPGRVKISLNEHHRSAYRRLYRDYQTVVTDLPVLREDRDFDGRTVTVTPRQLEALNDALSGLGATTSTTATAFGAQERGRSRLFKRLQHLS